MKKNPLVSVMLPSYQHASFLVEAIESVLNQTYTHIEVLIADDGSTDGSPDIIRQYSDPRIKDFFFPENTCFEVWNHLRDQASGDYVTYLGSDDVMEPEKLARQVACLEEHPEWDACFSWARGIDEASQLLTDGSTEACFWVQDRSREEWIWQLTMENNCLVAPSMLMRRDVFQELGGFCMDYRQIPDWDLWLRFLLKHSFHLMEEPLVRYRVHPHGENANVSTVNEESNIRMNYEHAHAITECILAMDEELFLRVFRKILVCPEAESAIEASCEKFFWLIDHFSAEVQTKGLDYYWKQARNPEFVHCMREKYHFGRKEFFQMEIERGSAKALADAKAAEEQCAEMLEKALNYLEAQ